MYILSVLLTGFAGAVSVFAQQSSPLGTLETPQLPDFLKSNVCHYSFFLLCSSFSIPVTTKHRCSLYRTDFHGARVRLPRQILNLTLHTQE